MLNPLGYLNYQVDIGKTQEFDATSSLDDNGNLTQEAKNDDILSDHNLKIAEGVAPSGGVVIANTIFTDESNVTIECQNSTGDPLVSALSWISLLNGAGNLGYDFKITINNDNPNNPTWSISGSTKYFPAAEIYIDHNMVWSFTPTATSTAEIIADLLTPSYLNSIPTSGYSDQPL